MNEVQIRLVPRPAAPVALPVARVTRLPVTPSEDALLRRLAQFERFGATLAPTMINLKQDIRSRDRRQLIREPGARWVPV